MTHAAVPSELSRWSAWPKPESSLNSQIATPWEAWRLAWATFRTSQPAAASSRSICSRVSSSALVECATDWTDGGAENRAAIFAWALRAVLGAPNSAGPHGGCGELVPAIVVLHQRQSEVSRLGSLAIVRKAQNSMQRVRNSAETDSQNEAQSGIGSRHAPIPRRCSWPTLDLACNRHNRKCGRCQEFSPRT